MNINIDAKFDIGSEVYHADMYHEYYAENNPYIIVGITVRVSDHTMKMTYNIERDGVVRTTSENFIFTTYEECKQFVNKQNKLLTNVGNMV